MKIVHIRDEQTFAQQMEGKTITDICIYMEYGVMVFEFNIENRRFLINVAKNGLFKDDVMTTSIDEIKDIIYNENGIGKNFMMYGTLSGSVLVIYIGTTELVISIYSLYEIFWLKKI